MVNDFMLVLYYIRILVMTGNSVNRIMDISFCTRFLIGKKNGELKITVLDLSTTQFLPTTLLLSLQQLAIATSVIRNNRV